MLIPFLGTGTEQNVLRGSQKEKKIRYIFTRFFCLPTLNMYVGVSFGDGWMDGWVDDEQVDI